MRNTLSLCTAILLSLCPWARSEGYNLRNISNKDGLSNSAILSMYQDMDGFMWFGSADGLNRYNGVSIQIYKPGAEQNSLSGNLIESIVQSADGHLWVQTNYGLNRLDRKRQNIERYNDYTSNYKLRTHPRFELFFVNEKMELVCFEPGQKSLLHYRIEGLENGDEVLDYAIDRNDNLWVFARNHTVTAHLYRNDQGTLSLMPVNLFSHDVSLTFASHQQDRAFIVDDTHALYEYDMGSRQKRFIDNLAPLIPRGDRITAIVDHYGDFYIALQAGGLRCLRKSEEGYRAENIDLNAGIFSLLSDPRQDIVWIGTDGNGVYACYNSRYSVKSTTYSNNLKGISMPVRTIYLDKGRTLWLGTKGNGIVRIADYDMNTPLTGHRIEYLNSTNSGLSDNSVYTITGSRGGCMWIGSDNGLDYYSGGRIVNLAVPGLPGGLKYVHSVSEANDSTILVATVGTGVVKLSVRWSGNIPSVTGARRYLTGKGGFSENYFFTSYRENDRTVWFGNRGHGAFRFDIAADSLIHLPFENLSSSRTVNDIFSIYEDPSHNIWFGTSYGLVRHTPEGRDEVFYQQAELPNNTIHGILSDHSGNLWLSTNTGIAMFNTKTNSSLIFNQSGEQQVMEFSDGAYFRDSVQGLLFFGGTNGFVTIEEQQDYPAREYMPSVRIDQLRIFGRACNINDYLSEEGNKLIFNYNENFIALDAVVTDYIDNNNYTYMYMVEGLSDTWINNGNSSTIYLTNLFPGNYVLKVKYINRRNGTESPEYTTHIHIIPPWYLSTVARIAYLLIVLLAISATIRRFVVKARRKRESMLEKLSREHQQELYESKLRFFTNIAHEFCTPLTLIAGPCERLLSYSSSDSQVVKYAELIRRNAQRMNLLIQDLIEFRRIETDNKRMHVTRFDIGAAMSAITSDFIFIAEEKKIEYIRSIPEPLHWNSDSDFITIIVTNLVSNAFKYTKKGGIVSVKVSAGPESLNISVTNSGKGLGKEDIEKIFDRYTILEEFENPAGEKPSTRNGLGLAISSNLVKLLGGKIDVSSSNERGTTFTVVLPPLEVAGDGDSAMARNNTALPAAGNELVSFKIPRQEFDKYRPTVMAIDDEPEILWLLSDIFSSDYNVVPVSDSRKVEELMLELHPDVVICDLMMPHIGGDEIARRIKSSPKTAHIPVILVSAIHQIDDQIKCLEAGAEMYLTKPFDVNYLRTFVRQLISRREKMREYYSSPISAYEFMEGKFTHKEHKRFAQQVYDIITSNIMDKKLSAQFIADHLGMSARHLYRKIEEIGAPSPSEMIRECRLHIAKELLKNTEFTIDEIIFKSGFSSRGPFFTSFTEKFGCSPREFRKNNRIDG